MLDGLIPYIIYLDVLDDMVTAPVSAPKAEAKKETKTLCEDDPAEQSLDDMLDNDDFAKQLAAGMEQLMGQMGGVDAEGNDEMKEAFEKVWASFDGDAAAAVAATTPAASTAPKVPAERQVPKVPQSFQDTIGQTMNKLKDSSKEINVSECVCVGKKKSAHNLLIYFFCSLLSRKNQKMILWLNS